MDRLLQQLEFIKEIDKLKYIFRKTKLINSERQENDAEHSWHLAMMTLILSEHSNVPIDVLKTMKMVLIHDLVEIDAGDTFIYDTTKNHDNTEEELAAAQRIFGMLPSEQAQNLIDLWVEFEEGNTAESKFARTMDRLEPLLQNFSNKGGTWSEYDVPYDKVFNKKKVMANGSEKIWDYASRLLEEAVEIGILKKESPH